jgi:hypothetical protein
MHRANMVGPPPGKPDRSFTNKIIRAQHNQIHGA